MTEAEWLASGDPFSMLCYLQKRGNMSARKARLFAVACCRRVFSFLPDDKHREAVEVSARFADGHATQADKERLSKELQTIYGEYPGAGNLEQPAEMIYLLSSWPLAADWMDACTGSEQAIMLSGHAHRTGKVLRSDRWFADDEWWEREAESAKTAERTAQVGLIRDIFGNPFHHVAVDPTWLAWNDGTVVKLAQGIYDERAFDHLPILADALEEAGCHDADILAHCRQPGEHVRGCWLVDLILGKE